MRHLSAQQGRQPVPAGYPVQEFIGCNLLLGLAGRPLGELIGGALPDDLISVALNATEAGFIKRKSVGAPQQGAAARPFPFSVLLLQFPGLELGATPAE